MFTRRTAFHAFVFAVMSTLAATAAGTLQSPEQFLGFKVGADNKLARWDRIVEYMKLAAANSDRVRFRELGKTSSDNPFIALEIGSPETLKNLDRYKQLERKLYFQDGAPTDAERDAIFREGRLVLLITCSIHATEIGASQMSVELVHRLATEDSPAVKKILDNVIFLLVPSLNPDGQIMVTDWFNKNVGTPHATSPIPYLYHPYVGHRSDQSERAPADLSVERHSRAVAGRGARSGRQGRHNLQQPVLHDRRRLHVAADQRRGALPEHERHRLGLAEG